MIRVNFRRAFQLENGHPPADLLRHKQFLYYVELVPEIASTQEISATIGQHFRAIAQFVEFLNTPFAGKKKKLDVRELFA